MKKSTYNNTVTENSVLVRVDAMKDATMLSRAQIMKIAKDANALRYYGRNVRIYVPAFMQALEK